MVLIGWAVNSGSSGMKLVHRRQLSTENSVRLGWRNNWVERDTVRVRCLAQEHNTRALTSG